MRTGITDSKQATDNRLEVGARYFIGFVNKKSGRNATRWAMSECKMLLLHWFRKQNKTGDAAGIHASTMCHVGKQHVDIPWVIFVKH